MTTTKTLIQDKLTGEFYCVEQTELMADGSLTAGTNDFPFWSLDVNEAYDFGSALLAKNDFKFNDLTCDGTREPVVIEIETEY